MTYAVTCCSTADLTKELLKEKNIPFVPFSLNIDGETIKDDYTFPLSELYARMKAGSMPTTSQVNVEEYEEFFEPFLKEGKDVFHITVSSGISGTYNSCRIAAEELNAKYDNKVHVLDSLCASSGYGMLVLLAGKNRDEGMSLEENYKKTEELRMHLHHWFFSTDLTYYVRGGRISKAAGLVGTALQLCPLMRVNREGKLEPVEKIRTKKKAIRRAAEMMLENAENGTEYDGPVFLSQSACLEDAEAVVSLIREYFPKVNDIRIFDVGSVIGAHTGPGTVALFFIGKERY